MGKKSSKIAVIAAVSTFWPIYASSQQGGVVAPATTQQPQAATATTAAGAQPAGGLQFDLNLAMTAKYDDNFALTPGGGAGDSAFLDTKLGFNLSSVTRAYSLNIGGSGVLRFGEIPGRSLQGFEDPTLDVVFATDSSNSRFGFDLRYRDVDREFLDPFKIEREEQNTGSLIEDGGDLRQLNGGLVYETGLKGPATFLFDYRHTEKDYSNVTSTRLFDTDQDKYQGRLTLRLNPVTRLRFSAALTEYEAQDTVQTNRRTVDYSIGVVRDIDKTLTLDAQIGHTDVETTTLLGTTERSGLTGAVTLTKALPDGSIYGTLSTTRNQNGGRTTLRFGRDVQFKNGALSASLGLTRGDITDTTDWIGSLGYTHQVQSSSFSLSLNRSASTNNVSEDLVNTRLSVGYGYTIDASSRLDLSLDWGRSEDGGAGTAPTVDRTTLRATYTRQLTADWNLQGGYIWRDKSETGLQDATSNSVFVTLDRNFSFRP